MLPLVAPSAVIELSFDPIVTVGGVAVRLETIGVALAILVGLVVAALVARRTPIDVTRPADAPGPEPDELNHLRRDDLLYIAVAAVPGAVVGGRLGYALIHLDGTDTYMSHGIKPKSQKMGEIKTGSRVKAVFKDMRRGTIGDFYFVPVD